MAKVYEFLATGFEEIEALTPVDVLRRCDVEVQMVSITGSLVVVSSHGIGVTADVLFEDVTSFDDAELLLLPGGMPGAANLKAHEGLRKVLLAHAEHEKYLGAICAAPMVLADLGLLHNKKATCSPGFERYFDSSTTHSTHLVAVDGKVVTGKGPAASLPYAYQLARILVGDEMVDDLQQKMQFEDLKSEAILKTLK